MGQRHAHGFATLQNISLVAAGPVQQTTGADTVVSISAQITQVTPLAVHKTNPGASAMQAFTGWGAGTIHGKIIQLGHRSSPPPTGLELIVKPALLANTALELALPRLLAAFLARLGRTRL